jgi:protease I
MASTISGGGGLVAGRLAGRRIAFLMANEGVEQIELTDPWQAVEQEGGSPVLVAPDRGSVQAFNHLDKGARFPVHQTVDEAVVEDFDGLVLPGGVANPDQLRTKPGAVALVREFVDAGKPVAAICHAPWTLIEAGAVKDKTLTSWPSVRTDLENAGAKWVDEQVHVDTDGGWTLVSSRKPGDLPAFCREAVRAFAG